jgi:DNA transposition AAA+ family ATPase
MNKVNAKTKKKRIETSAEWQKEKVKKGQGYNFKTFLTDPKIIELAKKRENKSEFVRECVREKFGVA